jgi:hypothetical protein
MFARWSRCVVSVAVGALLLALGPVPLPEAVAAPTLPSGFVLRDQATGQAAYDLTDLAYLPGDGGILTTGKSGKLTWMSPAGAVRTLATLTVQTTGDHGLVGPAVAHGQLPECSIYSPTALHSDSTATRRRGILSRELSSITGEAWFCLASWDDTTFNDPTDIERAVGVTGPASAMTCGIGRNGGWRWTCLTR